MEHHIEALEWAPGLDDAEKARITSLVESMLPLIEARRSDPNCRGTVEMMGHPTLGNVLFM